MRHLAERCGAEIDRRAPHGALVPMDGPVDRRPRGSGPGADVPVLFAVITDYGDCSPLEAATALWSAAHADHPDAVIHVIHPRDKDLVRAADGAMFWRGFELETIRAVIR